METVYHYTSLNGFLGIIGSRSLWATNAAYLNDAAEINHAIDFARRVTGAIYMQDDYLAAFGWVTRHALTDLEIGELYVTSFSEAPDLLSQWRGYCPTGAGLCLGFDLEFLKDYCKQQGYRLEKCIYGDANSIDDIHNLVSQCLEKFPKPLITREQFDNLDSEASSRYAIESHLIVTEGTAKQEADKAISWLCSEISELAPRLKNNGFHEEAEWRIIAKKSDEETKFRTGSSYLIPYVSLDLSTAFSKALREVIVGPNPNQRRCADSVMIALEQQNLNEVRLSCSSLPFNNW